MRRAGAVWGMRLPAAVPAMPLLKTLATAATALAAVLLSAPAVAQQGTAPVPAPTKYSPSMSSLLL